MADEHRIIARGDRLRRFEDPSKSTDPRVVAVLEHLSVVAREQAAVTPRAEFRAELRAQLVAITPRLVAEYAPANGGTEITGQLAARGVAVADRPRPSPRPRDEQPGGTDSRPPRRSFWDALRTVPIGRPLAVVASLVTVLALVLGGSVYLSQSSVPGDTLYGLKRASERFELSMADTDAERASDYLDFATTRVEEARELVSRASASAAGSGPLADGALSAQTSKYVTDALDSANGNTQTASRLLGTIAVNSASAGPLTKLTDWAPSQLTRLAELRAAVPAGTPVNVAASRSASLLQTAKSRAATLQQRVDCNCLKNSPTDVYGPLPAPTVGAKPNRPGSSATPHRSPRHPHHADEPWRSGDQAADPTHEAGPDHHAASSAHPVAEPAAERSCAHHRRAEPRPVQGQPARHPALPVADEVVRQAHTVHPDRPPHRRALLARVVRWPTEATPVRLTPLR